jgi:hypothetical protein
VIRLNKPTSAGEDDPKEIHYQKIEYKIVKKKKITQNSKLQNTQISLSHNRDYSPKENIKNRNTNSKTKTHTRTYKTSGAHLLERG